MISAFARWVCLPLLFAGCATPLATLRVQALPVGQQLPKGLAVEGTLRSGDQFQLQVEVPQAAYVYALRPTREQPERFFPESGHVQALPGTTLYVPERRSYLTLGRGRGRELVVVVASVRELDDEALRRLVQDKSGILARDIGSSEETTGLSNNAEGTPPPPPTPDPGPATEPVKKEDPPPPVPTGPVTRPGQRYVVQARLDKEHAAVLEFIFNHEPAATTDYRP